MVVHVSLPGAVPSKEMCRWLSVLTSAVGVSKRTPGPGDPMLPDQISFSGVGVELPPLLTPPLGSAGPAAPPTANLGLEADADSKVREAIHLLEMALPQYQTGSEKHKGALDALSKLSKMFPASAEVPGVQQTQLLALQNKAQQNGMLQALLRQAQAAGSPQAAPAVPPAAPEMAGG